MKRRANDFDAIVIGSGITGGWAAKELTEAGMRTLVLEAGPMVIPDRDYVEHVAPYRMPYRGWNDRKALPGGACISIPAGISSAMIRASMTWFGPKAWNRIPSWKDRTEVRHEHVQ